MLLPTHAYARRMQSVCTTCAVLICLTSYAVSFGSRESTWRTLFPTSGVHPIMAKSVPWEYTAALLDHEKIFPGCFIKQKHSWDDTQVIHAYDQPPPHGRTRIPFKPRCSTCVKVLEIVGSTSVTQDSSRQFSFITVKAAPWVDLKGTVLWPTHGKPPEFVAINVWKNGIWKAQATNAPGTTTSDVTIGRTHDPCYYRVTTSDVTFGESNSCPGRPSLCVGN